MSGIDGIFAVKGGKAFEAFDHSLPVPAGEVGSADSAAEKSIAREHHALGLFEIAHAAECVAGSVDSMESDIPYLRFKALFREQVVIDIFLDAVIDMGRETDILALEAGAVIGVDGYFRIRVVVFYMRDAENVVIVTVGEKNILEIFTSSRRTDFNSSV